ncbi:hypothetical protein U2088_15385, partial [Listeria monocytogenes]|uniref:hypothetical protein n=1 Tax=Listeria monocytogenes TaxID=1639 RepID=UPI002FDC6E97
HTTRDAVRGLRLRMAFSLLGLNPSRQSYRDFWGFAPDGWAANVIRQAGEAVVYLVDEISNLTDALSRTFDRDIDARQDFWSQLFEMQNRTKR